MSSNKNQNKTDFSAEITRLGNRGVRKAQEENRKLGLPNVYSKNGKIYYQLPNGQITTKKPESIS
ncbi:MAG: hypothetical protein R6V27_10880 [Balneolaceae bacterium]